MMKVFVAVLLLFTVFLSSARPSFAEEATPREVVQKVEQAAQLLAQKGDEAYRDLVDPQGSFVWKGTYVFAFDMSGNTVVHPNPNLLGKNLMSFKDVNGKVFAAEFLAIAKNAQGKGWSEYMWPKPGEKTPSLKATYVMKVPGKDLLVAAGVYDISKEDAEKATER